MAVSPFDDPRLDEKLTSLLSRMLDDKPTQGANPATTGLLAAGLGILANNRGNFSEAVGRGGLVGLQAMQEERQRQMKDPAAQLNMLNAVVGARQNMQNQEAMRNFQSGAPNMTQAWLQEQMRSPHKDVADRAQAMWDRLYKPQTVSQGQTLMRPDGSPVASVVDPKAPTQQPDGTYAFAPGALESMTEQKRREAEATAAAQARYQPVQTSQGGVPVTTTAAALEASQRGGNGPPGMAEAYAEYLKGDTSRPFQYTYTQPKQKLGVGISKAQEAADVQAATAPGAMDADYAKGVQTQNLKLRETMLEEGKGARAQNANLDRFMQLARTPGVAQGKFAENISALKNMAATFDIDIKGASAEQAMSSITGQMALQLRNPSSGLGMPGAMSDADREFLKAMPPGLNQTPQGREFIAENFMLANNRKVEVVQMVLRHEMNGGKIDAAFLKKLEDHAEKNPIFGEAQRAKLDKLGEPEKPQPKVTGATLRYHVDNIMRNGTDEQKRKLRESGLVQ